MTLSTVSTAVAPDESQARTKSPLTKADAPSTKYTKKALPTTQTGSFTAPEQADALLRSEVSWPRVVIPPLSDTTPSIARNQNQKKRKAPATTAALGEDEDEDEEDELAAGSDVPGSEHSGAHKRPRFNLDDVANSPPTPSHFLPLLPPASKKTEHELEVPDSVAGDAADADSGDAIDLDIAMEVGYEYNEDNDDDIPPIPPTRFIATPISRTKRKAPLCTPPPGVPAYLPTEEETFD